jgi:hypothetical protein
VLFRQVCRQEATVKRTVLVLSIVAGAISVAGRASANTGAPTVLKNAIVWMSGHSDCLDDPGFATGDVPLQGYPCNYGSNQMWTLSDAAAVGATRYFTVQNQSSHKCMEISLSSGQILQTTCNPSSFLQQWSLTSVGNGYYRLVNRSDGQCLDDGSDEVCGAPDDCRIEYDGDLQHATCMDDGIQSWLLGANAIPPPPPGSVTVRNNSQDSVIRLLIGGVMQNVGSLGIPPGGAMTFSNIPVGTASVVSTIGFNANSFPAANVGVCNATSNVSVQPLQATTVSVPALNGGQLLTRCGKNAVYNGMFLDNQSGAPHGVVITFTAANTFSWTLDGVAQPGGTISGLHWLPQASTMTFTLSSGDSFTMGVPFDVFTLTINWGNESHVVGFSRSLMTPWL